MAIVSLEVGRNRCNVRFGLVLVKKCLQIFSRTLSVRGVGVRGEVGQL